MSAIKFKIGDKVKVREGLVADKKYGDVYCASSMIEMGGKVLTIDCVGNDFYVTKEYDFCWNDQMLEPIEKTLDNLCAGDFVENEHGERKVLVAIDGCYLLSHAEGYAVAGHWYTATELDKHRYRPVALDVPEPTIEIDGKKYKKADVDKAIKDLEVVE